MTTPIEHAAEVIAQAQNVPFVGTKQRKIAEALAAAGLIATETEWGIGDTTFGIERVSAIEAAESSFPLKTRNVTPWKDPR